MRSLLSLNILNAGILQSPLYPADSLSLVTIQGDAYAWFPKVPGRRRNVGEESEGQKVCWKIGHEVLPCFSM